VFAHEHFGPPLSSNSEFSKMDQPALNRLRARDRAELSTLLTALHGLMNALRRDECGDPTIFGSRGHIRACEGMFSRLRRLASPEPLWGCAVEGRHGCNRSCPKWCHMGVAQVLLIEIAGISVPDLAVPTPPCDHIPQSGVCVSGRFTKYGPSLGEAEAAEVFAKQ
jgi:hypothetical protein